MNTYYVEVRFTNESEQTRITFPEMEAVDVNTSEGFTTLELSDQDGKIFYRWPDHYIAEVSVHQNAK